MASPSSVGAGRRKGDEGMHFTWLLSTEREDDLDMVSDGDEDDAMVQLDEEYMSEMERKAALRDQERAAEENDDIDQLELEDRDARAEYDDGRGLVSPRGPRRQSLDVETQNTLEQPEQGFCLRMASHLPGSSLCIPDPTSHRKTCTAPRALKKTKAFCAPNLELLRTLRVVKHVRLFHKILSGNAKISYGSDELDRGEATGAQQEDAGLGLVETHDEAISGPSTTSFGLRSSSEYVEDASENANAVEMDEFDVNEITGERTKKRTKSEPAYEPHVHLDLETGLPQGARTYEYQRQTQSQNLLDPLAKPTWPQRRKAAQARVKTLARETLANVKPGILTALINFPLVLAVAGGVGAHPYFGLNAAFWAALAATFFGGSRYTIAAPTMLLTSNLVDTVATYGTFVLPVIAFLAALMIYILVFTRAIEFMTFVPSMVTHGVTLGTSTLVIIYQLKFALGLAGNIHAGSVPYYILEMFSAAITDTNWRAVVLYVFAQGLVYVILRWGRGFNIAFILVPLGFLTGWVLDLSLGNSSRKVPYIETIGTRYGHVEFKPFLVGHWQAALFNWTVIGKSMEVAFICVMESYSTANLTYEVTGKRFSKSHEMFSLATANFISGVFGGMPTSVGVTRTLLNIRSGATSRAAGAVNALALLLLAITMTSFLRYFTMPVVAALQITAAWRSVDTAVWSRAWQEDRRSTFTSFITAMLCVVINPFLGLLIGIVISMSIFSRQLSKGHSELTVKTKVHRIQVDQRDCLDSPRPSSTPRAHSSSSLNASFSHGLTRSSSQLPTSSMNAHSPSTAPRPPSIGKIRTSDRSAINSSFTDLPASRTLSIRNAVAQLQPILNIESDTSSAVKYNVVVYRISGVMTFINAQTHFETLKAITQHKGVTCLILNVRFLYYIDYDGKVVLRNLIRYVDSHLDLPTYLVGVTMDLSKHIKRDQWYKSKKRDNLIWKLESDAFRDIQRRNAELIESGVAASNALGSSMATLPSLAGMDLGADENSAASAFSSSSSSLPGTANTTPSSIPFTALPITPTAPRSIAVSRSDLLRSSSLRRSSSISRTPNPGTTPISFDSAALQSASVPHRPIFEEPSLKSSTSKRKLSSLRSAIGSSSASIGGNTPSPSQGSPAPGTVTTEEMEMAIREAALSIGLDPEKAIASAEAFLRANRLHRDLQLDEDDPEAARKLQRELLGSLPSSSRSSPVAAGMSTPQTDEAAHLQRLQLQRKRNFPKRHRRKIAMNPSVQIGSAISDTGDHSLGNNSTGYSTQSATYGGQFAERHHHQTTHSDIPRGLVRFQYGTAPGEPSRLARESEGIGGLSSGAEFSDSDSDSSSSSSSSSGLSSSSDFADRIVTGAYSDYMTPVEDDSPLHLNLHRVTHAQSASSSTIPNPLQSSSYSSSTSSIGPKRPPTKRAASSSKITSSTPSMPLLLQPHHSHSLSEIPTILLSSSPPDSSSATATSSGEIADGLFGVPPSPTSSSRL